MRIQPVTDEIAESLGMDKAKGALVAGVIKGGPVDNGSIQPGDVIIKFDGKDVNEMRDLPRVVAESPVGKAVDVVIVRKGKEQTVKVTLGRLEDGEKLADTRGRRGPAKQDGATEGVSTAKMLGMTIGELDEATRKKFDIAKDVSGVVVTEVAENSAAAERGIVAGEVITEIAQESVSTPQGGDRPHRRAEGSGPQERAADARVEDRRAALRDDPDGLIPELRQGAEIAEERALSRPIVAGERKIDVRTKRVQGLDAAARVVQAPEMRLRGGQNCPARPLDVWFAQRPLGRLDRLLQPSQEEICLGASDQKLPEIGVLRAETHRQLDVR